MGLLGNSGGGGSGGGAGVPTSRSVNGHALSSDVTLTADDIDVVAYDMPALAVDVTKALNRFTCSATSHTLTFSATPANGAEFAVQFIGHTSDSTVTIPSCYSETQQGNITSFIVPANGKVTVYFARDASVTRVLGEPVAQVIMFSGGMVTSPATIGNITVPVILDAKYAFTITAVSMICTSGTATGTWKINTTALGGTANSISSTKNTQTHSSANAVAVADTLNLVLSSTSSLVDLAWTIKATRAF